MHIQVFRSFSCNNSSSFRLVARFSDPARAAEVKAELDEFLSAHARQMDSAIEENDEYPEGPVQVDLDLAAKHGFEWSDMLGWGDDLQEGDEPSVTVEGETLILYHTYCSGFGPDLPKYLVKRGARLEPEESTRPTLSALFRLPEGGAPLREELTKCFSAIDPKGNVDSFKAPWADDSVWGPAAFFCDGKTLGFYVPVDPTEIVDLRRWLSERGVDRVAIRICEPSDRVKLTALGHAKCSACGGSLEYLDPVVHDIEREHVACAACGGMFDVETILGEART